MINTTVPFEHITEPFAIHLARGALSRDQVRDLYADAPLHRVEQIARVDPEHEKQYRMNLLYLVKDGRPEEATAELPAGWAELLKDLLSDEFTQWLEAGTGLGLRGLPLDVGVYTHVDGDFISVHKDKPNKAITAILYLNEDWTADMGGAYEVRAGGDPQTEPVRRITPTPGQLLAFPPTDTSWHSVSKVNTGGTRTRLTVQLEFWHEDWATRHAK